MKRMTARESRLGRDGAPVAAAVAGSAGRRSAALALLVAFAVAAAAARLAVAPRRASGGRSGGAGAAPPRSIGALGGGSGGVGAGAGAGTGTAPRTPPRRLGGDGGGEDLGGVDGYDGGGGDADEDEDEAPAEDEDAASSSFDSDESAVQTRTGLDAPPLDSERVEEQFEKLNEREEDEDALFAVQEMETRLRPRGPLDLSPVADGTSNATRQFAHLHHMKTGGTSANRLINCALDRARGGDRSALPFASLEECGWGRYKSCTEGTDDAAERCRSKIDTAAAMQYCSPLFQMDRFGWLTDRTDVITVIRHPVDRVWSMFRFQTRGCYGCAPLLEVYGHIDGGDVGGWCDAKGLNNRGRKGGGGGGGGEESKGCRGVCIPQLLNHQTRNLMTTEWESPKGMAMSDEERIEEALRNLETKITVVGITEELPTFAAMLGEVFPWMSREGPGGGDGGGKVCDLPHANASPKNNRCGEDGKSHWDLPDHPDEETASAILDHNQLDLKLYEAAKRRFQLQKRALGLQ